MAANKSTRPAIAIGLNHRTRIAADLSAPVVFFCHGRGGDVDVMWSFRRAVPDHYHIMSLEAPLPDPIGGFSWWMVNQEHLLQRATQAATLAFDSMKNAISAHGLTSSKKVAVGFSQGGALLSLLAQKEPTFFCGVALLCGFVLKDPASTMTPARLPRFFFANGVKDKILPIEKAREGIAWLKDLGATLEVFEEDVGHKVGVRGMRSLKDWISSFDGTVTENV